ncbi:MAG: hypothetical protein BZY80_01895 [SAR202 cluster bacterium Io17-Chloro-G2]|nr:MAG: hypothetical protein BZY80_01895 [SAR202 cluster bacterium Io17-Chloro-G2]
MDRLRQTITEAVHGQSQPTVTVLSSLLAVQDAIGYIPKEALEEVAAFTGKTVNDIWAVASFYPNFKFEPLCQHTVEVCWGTTCHLVGAMPVMKSVLDTAGLREAGDTPDKFLSVGYNTCLGACSQAPVISVNHRLVGRVSPETAARRVSGLSALPKPEDGHGQ